MPNLKCHGAQLVFALYVEHEATGSYVEMVMSDLRIRTLGEQKYCKTLIIMA